MTELSEDEGGRARPSVQASLFTAQFRMMVHAARVFLVVSAVNFLLIALTLYPIAPWWLALPIPLAASLRCAVQFGYFLRVSTRNLSPAEIRHFVLSRARWTLVTSTVVSLWSLGISLSTPPHVAYFIVFVSGFTALGTMTYVAYLPAHMRYVLVVVGAPMFCVFTARMDPLGLTMFGVYVGNAYLLQRCLTGHFASVRAIVTSELETRLQFRGAKKAQAEISRIANTDELTGIANRRAYLNLVARMIETRRNGGDPFALGVIDLDGFKPVNDFHGHAAGDAVLIEVARRLSDHIGSRGAIARLGGDEFAILITEVVSRAELKQIGDEAIALINAPIPLGALKAQVSASCGFAIFPEAGATPTMLLERADDALYEVKHARRSTTLIYDIRKEAELLRRAAVEQRLRLAIESEAIDLHYQPIVCATSGRVLAFEALARWTDEQHGLISPGEFVPMAERCGLIGVLTKSLMDRGFRAAAAWPSHISLSFNVSAVQFADPALGLCILSALDKADLAPSRLTIEITETAVLDHPEQASETLEVLRGLGVQVAIDDFGTGYSSLGNLDQVPIDVIKLDRSFITKSQESARRHHMVAAVVDMCGRLGLRCVAEGVETEAQRQFAATIGCDALQGYLFGRPLPAAELTFGAAPADRRVA